MNCERCGKRSGRRTACKWCEAFRKQCIALGEPERWLKGTSIASKRRNQRVDLGVCVECGKRVTKRSDGAPSRMCRRHLLAAARREREAYARRNGLVPA
jgi:hypothetical protein